MTSSANPVVSFTEPVVSDSDSLSSNNDIIASSQPLNLSVDNPQVLVEAEFAQRFEDRSNTADATEDVDMFSVELQTGDRITIDADSVPYQFEGFSTGPGPDIRVFNAAGEPVVVGVDEEGEDIFAESRQDPAPDEAFIAGRDGYLEFTAPETGTYYIGASHYRNNIYDPNEVGSGSGAIFSPRFGVGPGPYTLEVALNPEGFDGEVFEEFTGEAPADSPVVSFAAVPGTFGRAEDNNDLAVSSELIESEPSTVGILDFTFNVEGDIPEGGLEVFVKSDTDFNTYFEGLQANPRVAVGGEITGGLYDAEGGLIGFKARLDANNARFPYNASDRTDDPEEPETLTFSLANSSDYITRETTAVSEVTFFDNLAQVQVEGGPVPEVGITIDNTELIESEGTETTITVNVEGEIPEGGLLVYIDGEEGVLGDFDVFNAEIEGGTFPAPNGNASGFFFPVLENTATISLQVFDETTNDQIPPEDALEGVEEFSLSVQPNTAYTIDPNASTIEFSILDNPDSVPLLDDSDDGDDGDEGDTDGPVTDNDGRTVIDDIIANAVATGLSSENPSVVVEGSIDVRWRNGDPAQRTDNTEDVDMFSFELAAGETITIESESVPFELNGITQETTPTLRVFDETGVELVLSDADIDLEFTATEAGTYYVGVSQYLNDNYDPNMSASGDGVQLVEDGISPGPYTLDIALAEIEPTVPVVSITTDTPVVSEDENPVLNLTLTVDGPIPEGGVPITFAGDFTDLFVPGFLDGNVPPITDPEDGLIPVANRDPEFDVNLTAPVVTLEAAIFDDIIEEEPLTLDVEILGREGTLIGDNVATLTFVDGDSVIPGSGPTVSLSVSDTELEEGDEFTVSFDTEGEIPDGGLQLFLAAGPTALGEFNIFNEDGTPAIELEGINEFPIQGGDEGGFFVTLAENQASITLSVFEDGANEGLETLTFDLLNGEIYEVDSDASSISFTINDFETIGTSDADEIVGDDADNSIDGLLGDDLVAGGLGNDTIVGGEGDDVLRGDANSRASSTGEGGDDIIFGGAGNDRIGGKDGNDLLSGDEGDDEIFGDDGDDTIMGVTGNDILTGDDFSGGSGSDVFVFGNGDGTDTITDFEVGTDFIGLVEGELTFEDIKIIEIDGNSAISVMETGETLAVLNGVGSDELTPEMFVVTPDVSSLQDLV